MSADQRSSSIGVLIAFGVMLFVALWLATLGQTSKTQEPIAETQAGIEAPVLTARAGDTVRIDFSLALRTGEKVIRGTQRIRLASPELIEGLWQGIVGMRTGDTRAFVIPADKAYGERGRPGVVPPNADLNALVTLLEVIPADQD